jgi:hypothetical protein
MTMGQHVDLVRRLGTALLSKEDRRLLDRITELRNDFVHGRLPREQGTANTLEFLSLARKLCQSRLLAVVAESGASKAGMSERPPERSGD